MNWFSTMFKNYVAVLCCSVFAGYCLMKFSAETWVFLNSNFAAAMFGAFAGSGTILFIEKLRRQDELFKDTNLSLMMLDGVLSSMLAMKQQVIMPLKNSYEENLKKVISVAGITSQLRPEERPTISTGFVLSMPPSIEIDLSLEKLKVLSAHFPHIIRAVIYLKTNLADFKHTHARLMDLHVQFKTKSPEEIFEFCYLFKQKNFSSDTTYKDLVYMLTLHADDVLWLSNKAMNGIIEAAKKEFPSRMHHKILKNDAVKKYADLMPPNDHMEKTAARTMRVM